MHQLLFVNQTAEGARVKARPHLFVRGKKLLMAAVAGLRSHAVRFAIRKTVAVHAAESNDLFGNDNSDSASQAAGCELTVSRHEQRGEAVHPSKQVRRENTGPVNDNAVRRDPPFVQAGAVNGLLPHPFHSEV